VLSKVLHLVCETLLSHSKIINDQGQVLIDSVEVLQLLSHDVGLLIELLDLKLSWTNVSLKLLDFVIKHELELLKLLSLLFQIDDSLILIFDGRISFLKLTFLTLDLLFEVVCILEELIKLLILFVDSSLFSISLSLTLLEVIMDESQITLRLHSLINDLGKLFFVFVFELIDLDPGLVFDPFSFLLVTFHHRLNIFFEPISLLSLPVKLDLLILFQLLDDLLMME